MIRLLAAQNKAVNLPADNGGVEKEDDEGQHEMDLFCTTIQGH